MPDDLNGHTTLLEKICDVFGLKKQHCLHPMAQQTWCIRHQNEKFKPKYIPPLVLATMTHWKFW
jgi:hypothetical protein